MMFADGTLDDDERNVIARAMNTDPNLAARVAAFSATRDLLKGAFAAPISQQPPARLVAAIMSDANTTGAPAGADIVPFKKRAESTPKAGMSGWVPMALAAGFAGVTAGIAGFMVGEGRFRPASAVAALASSGPPALAGLGAARDGQDVAFGPNLMGSVSGSYRMADRRICRTLSVKHAPSGTAADGVACLNGGSWRVELALPRDEASAMFRPASGAGPVDALLEAGGAEGALSARDVEELISRNWR